jgi:hypothetical protein
MLQDMELIFSIDSCGKRKPSFGWVLLRKEIGWAFRKEKRYGTIYGVHLQKQKNLIESLFL